jgi:hypothetical protein
MRKIKIIALLLPVALFVIGVRTSSAQQKPGLPKVKTVVVYDEKFDKLVSKKTKESETTYDAHGNVLEEITYSNGKIDTHMQYQYDANDNKIKEIELDSNGKVTKTSEYKYDKGMRVEKTIAGPDGKVRTKKTYVYTTY